MIKWHVKQPEFKSETMPFMEAVVSKPQTLGLINQKLKEGGIESCKTPISQARCAKTGMKVVSEERVS